MHAWMSAWAAGCLAGWQQQPQQSQGPDDGLTAAALFIEHGVSLRLRSIAGYSGSKNMALAVAHILSRG